MHLYTGGNHTSLAQNDIMFYDVPDGASYLNGAADAALTLGFISGHDDGMFCRK